MYGDQNDLDRTGLPLSCRAVKGAGNPSQVPPVPKLLLNAQERSVVFNWVYHMNLRWVGTRVLWRSSVHQTMLIIMMIRMILNSSKYCQNRMRDAVPNNKPMEDEKLDHRTSESMPICHHHYLWQYLEPQTCFEGRISVFCFFGTPCQKIFEIFVLDSSKKSCQIESFPSDQWSPNRQCKVQIWFVNYYKSSAKIF